MDACFVDLDGVLVDFVGGAIAHHKLPLPALETDWNFWRRFGLSDADFWNPLGDEFWASLAPTEDMHQILGAVFDVWHPGEEVFLLSSPCLTPGCITGKARWVEKHLPALSRRLLLTDRKELFAGPGRVLVDDHDVNCEKWTAAGGEACLVPRPWNSARERAGSAVTSVVARLERIKQL